MKIQRKIMGLVALVLWGLTSWSQSTGEPLKIGEISFVSGANYYVKLPAGNLLETGDTLFIQINGKIIPALVVKQKSSLSCLTEKITEKSLAKGEVIYANPLKLAQGNAVQEAVAEPVTQVQVVNKENVADSLARVEVKKDKRAPGSGASNQKDKDDFQLHGRVRLLGMMDLPVDSFAGRSTFRYSVYLKGDNALVKGLSFESYLLFNHTQDVFKADSANPAYGLKTYGLNLQYHGKQDYWITLGRKINSHLSNLGASDGIQLEKKWGAFQVGALYGYRPDYTDYSFNTNLPQFGLYVAYEHGKERLRYQHSLAFMEQQNSGATDRRFLYGQSSGKISKSLSYFGSLELDLYQKLNGVASTTLSLTGLYFNLNWVISNQLNLSTSYQARQPVIFYETYQSYVDQLLDREINQGYRLRMNYRPWKWMNLSLSGGFRYEDGDQVVAQNYSGVLNLRNLPMRSVSTSLSATYNRSSYFNAMIYGVRMTGDLIPGKLSASLSYRNLSYSSTLETSIIPQHMVELSLDYRLSKQWLISLNYELLQQTDYPHNRLFLQLRYRF